MKSTSKYYIRVMRPIFQRAIFTVEAESDEAAVESALARADQLTDQEWSRFEPEVEPALVEAALPEEEAESRASALKYLADVQHAYVLLQANLDAGEGHFIAPTWLHNQPTLMIADLTRDWLETISGVHKEGMEAFTAWLEGLKRPTNVVDFLAEREKRRGKQRN